MTTPDKTAARILQQQGYAAPRLPPIEDLAELARAYQRLAGRHADDAAGIGQVYVTLAAARSYLADMERLGDAPTGIEEARRELTELLLDATTGPLHGLAAGQPEAWRARSRTTGLDVSARVAREGRLAIVVSVTVRDYNRSGPR